MTNVEEKNDVSHDDREIEVGDVYVGYHGFYFYPIRVIQVMQNKVLYKDKYRYRLESKEEMKKREYLGKLKPRYKRIFSSKIRE